MAYYLMIFVAGIAGSFHCVGMCGGFACALGRDPVGRRATIERHLLYNTGRLATYSFIGALAGTLGQGLVGHGSLGSIATGQRILAAASGVLMIVMALQFFGYLQRVHRFVLGFGGNTLTVSLRNLIATPGRSAPLALGVFNGWLPCPLVYALAAQAAATAGALPGFLTMLAFGLGTYPAMLIMGGAGAMIRPSWRRRGVWLAGILLLILGAITLGRGLIPLAGHGQPL
jgi:sulfite exporter TauE/SafE